MSERGREPPRIDFWFDRWPTGLLVVVGRRLDRHAASLGGVVRRRGDVAEHDHELRGDLARVSDRARLGPAAAGRRRPQGGRGGTSARGGAAPIASRSAARRRHSAASPAIALELERLRAALERTLAEQHGFKYFFPDLPDGSWQAGGGPLGRIISNHGLIADLSTFYGHVAELRWRLRFKAQPGVDESAINPIIGALAAQMLNDVGVMIDQVRKQVLRPDVTPVAADSPDGGGIVVGRRQVTGAIRAVTFDGGGGESSMNERVVQFRARDGFACEPDQRAGPRAAGRGARSCSCTAPACAPTSSARRAHHDRRRLVAAGYDVWLENWRASIDLAPNEWTLDQAAVYDHPAAVRDGVARNRRDDLQAMVHCQGSTSFMMSAVAGLPAGHDDRQQRRLAPPVVPAWSRAQAQRVAAAGRLG